MCPLDGMTIPCNTWDFPTPYKPVVNLDGVPVAEYEFPSSSKPDLFSIDECLRLNPSFEEGNMILDDQKYFFGELIPPYVDILGRGAHFRPSDESSLKYSSTAKCYYNLQPKGSILYQRMVAYYGPAFDIQTGYPHQGYGQAKLLNKMYGVSPPIGYDISLKYFYGEGTTYIDLPHARKFDATYNCTPGIQLMNSTLIYNEQKIVYTSSTYDYEGGADIENCPVFDDDLNCFVDATFQMHSRGECCLVLPWKERAIFLASDQFYPGTCEADLICNADESAEAIPCPAGFVCDEATTLEGSQQYQCAQGYSCDFGTTPDLSLEALANGQFGTLCNNGYECMDGTDIEDSENLCPTNFFCPTGTADSMLGLLAEDGMNRDIDEQHGNPNLNQTHIVYTGGEDFYLLGEHQKNCMDGVDSSLKHRYKVEWLRSFTDLPNSHIEYLVRSVDRNSDGKSDPPYISDKNISGFDRPVRPKVENKAILFDLSCARDHKWELVGDAIRRKECNCVEQSFIIAAVYRLWKCTANKPLEDLGVGARKSPDYGRGKRDFWFDRIHHNRDLAIQMDEAMEGYNLKWGVGSVCEWPDTVEISLTTGKIPYEGEKPNDGFGGRLIDPIPGKGIPPSAGGLLQLTNRGDEKEPDVQFSIQFTWLEKKTFANYAMLKEAVIEEFNSQLSKQNTGITDSIDPFTYDLHHAVIMIELHGEHLEQLVGFREKTPMDDDSLVIKVSSENISRMSFDAKHLVPSRLDSCQCLNLLKCPNGTFTDQPGSKSIHDCSSTGNDVLRRYSIVPSQYWKNHSKIKNGTDYNELGGGKKDNAIGTLVLESLEVAVFTLDLTSLPQNITYGDDYRIAIYDNCKPCPPRYTCSALETPTCASPSTNEQIEKLNNCLRINRVGVCVQSNGTTSDFDWCQKQLEEYTQNNLTDEKAEFEKNRLIYTEPDLHKCFSMPYFCEDTSWNYRTFRRLCQESSPDGQITPFYDCSLHDRWDDWVSWRDELCCSNEPEFMTAGLEPCIYGKCSNDPRVHAVIKDKFIGIFTEQHGFHPPDSQPYGSFIMNVSMQEERYHPAPLDLFKKWKKPASQEPLKPHNIYDPQSSLEWLHLPGCCRCQPHSLPFFL